MHRKYKIQGFSLVELMVVITVIALLSIVSIPSYLRYIQRASLTEAVSIMGNYRTSLGIYWSTQNELPTAGSTLIGSPANLPFGTLVNTNLPDTIESILLNNSGNGVLITITVKQSIFATSSQLNRELNLGAKPAGNELVFACGNFTPNASGPDDRGFPDRAMLPGACNYNGVSTWLAT